jgi:hypothetical protein
VATRKLNWGEDRVMFFDSQGRLRSLLASWTDIDGPDELAQAAADRPFVRVNDLVELTTVIAQIRERVSSK